jgi:hypothetical protein
MEATKIEAAIQELVLAIKRGDMKLADAICNRLGKK